MHNIVFRQIINTVSQRSQCTHCMQVRKKSGNVQTQLSRVNHVKDRANKIRALVRNLNTARNPAMEIITRLCIHEPYVCLSAFVSLLRYVFVTKQETAKTTTRHKPLASIRTPSLFLFPLSICLYQSVLFSQVRSVCPGLLNHQPQTQTIADRVSPERSKELIIRAQKISF